MNGRNEPPIACTLQPGSYQERVAKIVALARDGLRAVTREDLRLELTYTPNVAARVREMVGKEQECCGFLSFELAGTDDEVRLTITAPERARDVADAFFEQFVSRDVEAIAVTAYKETGTMATKDSITKELYDAFQTLELDRWDAIVAKDVLINSPAGRDLRGLEILKSWAREFGGGFAYQIDLVDEHLALDDQNNGRGFITFNLHWKHANDVFGLKPTGREGTSVETMLLTIRNGKIIRIDVADNSLDLVIYMWDRGWNHPHNVRPDTLVRGIDRRAAPEPATV